MDGLYNAFEDKKERGAAEWWKIISRTMTERSDYGRH